MSNTLHILAGAAVRSAREQSLLAALNFVAKALRGPAPLAQWIEAIERHHRNHGGTPPNPRILRKPLRNYGRVGRNVQARVDALCAHYVHASSHLPKPLIARILNNQPTTLATINARGEAFTLVLTSSLPHGQKQEGELTLHVLKNEAVSYARIGFSFGRDNDGEATLLIGGLQGLDAGADKRIIVTATRQMSGLRPKDAALVGVQAIARAANIKRILAVSNATHILASENALSSSVIQSDYDGFWADREGHRRDDGTYELPIPDYQARVDAAAAPRILDQHRASISSQVIAALQ